MQENIEERINSVQENEGPSQDIAIDCSPFTFMIEKEEIKYYK